MTTHNSSHRPAITLRPAVPADRPAIFGLFDTAARRAIGMRHRETERPRTLWARYAGCRPGLVAQVAVTGEALVGALIAAPPQARTMVLLAVDGAWRERGAAEALLNSLVAEATRACRARSDATVTLVQRRLALDTAMGALLRRQGWRSSRAMLRMERDLSPADQTPAPLDGVEIRPFRPESELEPLLLAHHLAFRGSETYSAPEFALELARWRQRLATDSGYDPSLWFVALAPDTPISGTPNADTQIAGLCLCTLDTVEDDGKAWVSRLAVRPPWRRQGIGLALLAYAFGALAKRGKQRVGLNVVAGNDAAIALYRQAGMAENPRLRFNEYELPVCNASAPEGAMRP